MKKLCLHIIQTLLYSIVLFTFVSCEQNTINQNQEDVLFSLLDPNNLENLESRGDSLYHAGIITDDCRKYFHAYSMCKKNQQFNEAIPIFKEILKKDTEDRVERLFQICAASELTLILRYQGHVESAMLIALDAKQRFTPEEAMTDQMALEHYIRMKTFIGDGMVTTGNYEEAETHFRKVFDLSNSMQSYDIRLEEWYPHFFELYEIIFHSYTINGQYEHALEWIKGCEEAADAYFKSPKTKGMPEQTTKSVEGYLANAQICKAVVYQHMGKEEDAKEAFQNFLKSDIANTEAGKINRAYYLLACHHYKDAADLFQSLDNALTVYSPSISLAWLHEYYLPKFQANLHAGNIDSANVQAMMICEALDTTLTAYMHNEGGQQGTIYTSLKDKEKLVEQETRMMKQRTWGLVIILVLMASFFITYLVRNRIHSHKLAEIRASQERIENELHIAREIQMSMVPHSFPHNNGLDMYAFMEPAKEVGGDLYGYVHHKDRIYFGVGDVSGKGIPASLFMAQVTRLFHTLADEGLMPAKICTVMNKELSGEDNINGMFVTLFIGLLDIRTGHLTFCNAGHNPPIIGCGSHQAHFLEMEPNAPIGLWPDLEYVGEEIDSIKGQTFLVYTDGLNEAENMEQEQYGDDRLINILREIPFTSSQQIINLLDSEVMKHRQGASPNDDLTMLCISLN